jgi:hypothetical protein
MATNCTYPPFTTLALCSTFENLTAQTVSNCRSKTGNGTFCTYDWQGRNNVPLHFDMAFRSVLNDSRSSLGILQNDLFKTKISTSTEGHDVVMHSIRVREEDIGNEPSPRFELVESRWNWCAQTYTSTAVSAAILQVGPVATEMLEFESLKPNNEPYEWSLYRAKSTGDIYHVSYATDTSILSYLSDLLEFDVASSNSVAGTTLDIFHGRLLYTADLGDFTTGFAATMSNYIRSHATGDNANASAVVGRAYVNETFIDVRWGWLLLPLLETLVTAGLLALTIWITAGSGQPLLKSSALGLLFYGLDSWIPGGMQGRLSKGNETEEELECISKGMMVQFADDGHGRLRFVQT